MIPRLRSLASLITSGAANEARPVISLEHLESGTGRLFKNVDLTEQTPPSIGVAAVDVGDVLFGKLRPYLAKTWLVDRPVYASTELLSLRPKSGVDRRWLSYVCSSLPLIRWASATADGTKMPRTSWEKLSEYRIAVPTFHSQSVIAHYLDVETARIDAIIEKKQRMINLLDEALLARVEANLCATSSSHIILRRLLKESPQYGASEVGEVGQDSWPRYIRITDLGPDGTLRDNDIRRLKPSIAQAFLLRDKDILIARSGATVGKAFIYRASMGPCCFAGYLIRFRLNETIILPELAELWMRTAHYWDQIREATLQATIENVSAGRYKSLLVPVPPRGKQDELLRLMRHQRALTRQLRTMISKQIMLLHERRQALITSAVTGELDIPGANA